MTEQEKALVAEIKSDIAKVTEKQVSSIKDELGNEIKAVKADFEKVNEKLADLAGNSEALAEIKTSIDVLNVALKAQGEAIEEQNLRTIESEKPHASELDSQLKSAFVEAGFNFKDDGKGNEIVSEGQAKLKGFASGTPIEVKAAHVMGSSDVTGLAIPYEFNTMGKDIIPMNTNDHVTDFFPVRTTSEVKTMSLLVEYDLEGDIDTTAEGVASGLISIKLKSKEFVLIEASVMATISWKQNMETPELMDAIKRLVPDRIKQYVDAKVLTTGGDNSAEVWGALNVQNGTEFNPLEYAGIGAGTANTVDLVTYMKNQCQTADYSANGVFLGDKKKLQISAIRDTTNNNIIDRRLGFGNDGMLNTISGLAVKESRLLPDTILVSVTNMNRIKFAKDMQVVAGFNADDLSKRRVSTVWSFIWSYGSQNVNANIWTSSETAALAIINENATASLARINGYATGSDATDMTIQMMINAGGDTLIASNLAAYKVAVAAEAGIANATALQVVIDAVNAA